MKDKKVEEVVSRCIEKWGNDSRTDDLQKVIDGWLENIRENDRDIYLRLLYNFRYYSKKSENKYAQFVIRKVKEIDNSINESIFVPLLKTEEGISGAYKLIRCIQLIGGLNSVVCPTNLAKFEKDFGLDAIKNVIIVDDISGTGKTLSDNLKYMKELYPNFFINKNIYITCLVTTENANKQIRKQIENGKTRYWTYHIMKKSFEANNIFRKERCGNVKKRVEEYELLLSKKDKSDIFGFKQSELLVAFSDNTPNNTLLSFWKKTNNWEPIFPRAKTASRPSWARNAKGNQKKNVTSNLIELINSK
ncbi:phosphoribosyltransferase [Clostridium beijerinckii]|uniref:phosphoribosyltransferase n=1 Tax=Clostridium beijerinckii TaxID=1520 RepID=UPI001F1AD62F|nr:phosphoribosyltransferase [Clostridium beijerinckii]